MRRRPFLLPGVVAALILIAGNAAADVTYPWTNLVTQPVASTTDLVGNKTSEYASAAYKGGSGILLHPPSSTPEGE